MNIIISDITGRTLNYDYALCNAVCENLTSADTIEFWGPEEAHNKELVVRRFGSIVPNRFKTSSNTFIRLLKAIDAIFAYTKILYNVARIKPDVFHLQWFPFLSIGTKGAAIDISFIRMIRKISSNTRLVFTIHNMCPHAMSENDRAGYNPIFTKALSLFDHFVVHTEKTKEEVIESFRLKEEQVSLVYHGVFKPKGAYFEKKAWNKDEINLIMYGAQNWYKGTDIFIEALALLPEDIKEKLKISICGCIDTDTNNKCKAIATGCEIEWMSYYLDDELLYKKINESDIILLPYRRISQSGVLLLAIATKRLIITSNLPTFRETLKGYDEDMFFKSEDSQSLSSLICKYINGEINREKALAILESLEELYSWDESAKRTISIYNAITK